MGLKNVEAAGLGQEITDCLVVAKAPSEWMRDAESL